MVCEAATLSVLVLGREFESRYGRARIQCQCGCKLDLVGEVHVLISGGHALWAGTQPAIHTVRGGG